MNRKATRRKFLKGAAASAAVAGGVAAPAVVRAEPMVLKMQAAWGGGIFLENAKSPTCSVSTTMAGKDLKIDLLARQLRRQDQPDAGRRSPRRARRRALRDRVLVFQVQGPLRCSAPAPASAGPAQELLGWIHYGGGKELFNELMGETRHQRRQLLQQPDAGAAARLVQGADQ